METRQGHAAGADLQWHDHRHQPDHQRQREEDQARHPERGEQPVEDHRLDQRVLGDHQLQPHHQELGDRGGREEEGGGDVHPPDGLVLGAGHERDPGLLLARDLLADDLGVRCGADRRHFVSNLTPGAVPDWTRSWTAARACLIPSIRSFTNASYSSGSTTITRVRIVG